MSTRTEKINHVPKADLQKLIARFQADPDYISHTATQEDSTDFWTLVVTLKAAN
jgi:hypothetical protein